MTRTETRPVRSADPSLSDHANDLLTQELREVIGRDEVELPADRADITREAHATHSPAMAGLVTNRVGVAVGLGVALTEHLDPSTVEQLEREGVADPDALFTQLVAEFTVDKDRAERRTVHSQDDPATAAREQRRAVTPTSGPSRPQNER